MVQIKAAINRRGRFECGGATSSQSADKPTAEPTRLAGDRVCRHVVKQTSAQTHPVPAERTGTGPSSGLTCRCQGVLARAARRSRPRCASVSTAKSTPPTGADSWSPVRGETRATLSGGDQWGHSRNRRVGRRPALSRKRVPLNQPVSGTGTRTCSQSKSPAAEMAP